MKPILLSATVLGLSAIIATAALSGDRHGGRLFDRLDSDDNGVVSQAEVEDAASSRFARKDSNGDGFLDINEVLERWTESPIDSDGDGMVSEAEHEAVATAMFARADANGDGEIDEDEANAVRERMRERHRKGE